MNELLKDTAINKTCFKVKGDNGFFAGEYRLTNYMFIYKTWDGIQLTAFVTKEQANGVSGAGVCGMTKLIEEVEILPRISKFNAEESDFKKHLIKQDEHKYKFLKSLPQGLTKEQVDFFAMEQAIESAMKDFKKKPKKVKK